MSPPGLRRSGTAMGAGVWMLAAFVFPAFAADPPLPAQPAAEIDPTTFSHAMPVTVPASLDGVGRLRVPPALLAVARPDLADLRVVDAAARQWPYVLRVEAGHEDVALEIELHRAGVGRSRYALGLPVTPAAVDAVELRVDRELYDRSYSLTGELADGAPRSVVLASGRIVRAAGGRGDTTLAFQRARVNALALFVDDGDEAPLPLASARASLPVAELYLVAPAGEYSVLTGDAEAGAPRYDIARLRDQVLATTGVPCAAGAVGPNPRYRSRAHQAEGFEQVALWGVMGLAVVVLAALALRLSRGEQKDRW